ncbi:flagellar basal body rod C-terminal domain-containing protein, partial [Klebsiella pneumoniae]
PDTSNLGKIQAGSLEASTVDLTEQLVNMITAQRNFQANAQMITTQDQITQTVINIR